MLGVPGAGCWEKELGRPGEGVLGPRGSGGGVGDAGEVSPLSWGPGGVVWGGRDRIPFFV